MCADTTFIPLAQANNTAIAIAGYSGIENPLFYKQNTRMYYGDAKDSMDKLIGLL